MSVQTFYPYNVNMVKRSKKMKRNTRKNKKVFVGGKRTDFSSKVLTKFLNNLIDNVMSDESKMIEFYKNGAKLSDVGDIPPTPTSGTPATIQSIQTSEKYGEWQMYIQDLIMALKNFTPGTADVEKRNTAIFILQKLNDINLWDQFQRTFFTGYVDNLDTSERDNYTKETKIVMSTVPNLFHMFNIDDGKLSKDRKKLTNTHFRIEEKFKNGSKFLNEINNVEERILLMRLLSSGDPETLQKIDNYKKNSQEKVMPFSTSYPFLSNNNIEKFQSVGGRKTKKRSKLKS